jgi:hypothetical protein
MKYDFYKLSQAMSNMGRILYEGQNGTVVYQTNELPLDKPIKISAPDEEGVQNVTCRGCLVCSIKKYPSKEAYIEHVKNEISKIDKEEFLAHVIEEFGIW